MNRAERRAVRQQQAAQPRIAARERAAERVQQRQDRAAEAPSNVRLPCKIGLSACSSERSAAVSAVRIAACFAGLSACSGSSGRPPAVARDATSNA